MKNLMTTTETTAAAIMTPVSTVKITATDKYLTFRDGVSGKVIGKIAKGEGYIIEYNEDYNETNVYTSGDARRDCDYLFFLDVIEFTIKGDIYEPMLAFFEEKNIKIIKNNYYICNINRKIQINNKEGQDDSPTK